jgi:hypothetical protein
MPHLKYYRSFSSSNRRDSGLNKSLSSRRYKKHFSSSRYKKHYSSHHRKKHYSSHRKRSSHEKKVHIPESVKINVYMSGPAQIIPAGVDTIIRFNAIHFDVNNGFILSNSQFQPKHAGHYFVNTAITFTSGLTQSVMNVNIRKNGIQKIASTYFSDTTVSPAANTTEDIATLIYMNGTTDYLEVLMYLPPASPSITLVAGQDTTYFIAFRVE